MNWSKELMVTIMITNPFVIQIKIYYLLWLALTYFYKFIYEFMEHFIFKSKNWSTLKTNKLISDTNHCNYIFHINASR